MNSGYRIFVWASVVILLFTLPAIGYVLLNREEIQQEQAKRLIQYYNSKSEK